MKYLNSLELQKYYFGGLIGKTVLPSYRFYVTFLDNEIFAIKNKKLYNRIGSMPTLEHFHVLSVNVPTYDFKKEIQKFGPAASSFPYLDFQGFDIKIDFEEDDAGTISYFINWMQRRVMDQNGLYTPPNQLKLDRLIIEIEDSFGNPVMIYSFHKIFILDAQMTELNYGNSDTIKWSTTWSADFVKPIYLKASGRALVKDAAIEVINEPGLKTLPTSNFTPTGTRPA